ncbi:MAG: GC-type dockerin domain-anchored protein [Planctomycetota bacterium]
MTGELLGDIGEVLTFTDVEVSDNGDWYAVVNTVTNGNTGEINGNQRDPVLIGSDGIIINRLAAQPGPVFFPALTGLDPAYELTTIEQIAVNGDDFALFQTAQFETPFSASPGSFARGYSRNNELLLLEQVVFDGLQAGAGAVTTFDFVDTIDLLDNGNIVAAFDVNVPGPNVSGIFEFDPGNPAQAVSVLLYEDQVIPGVGVIDSFANADRSFAINGQGDFIASVQLSDAPFISNGRLVRFDSATQSYTVVAEDRGSPIDQPDLQFANIGNGALAINQSGDWLASMTLRSNPPGLSGSVIVKNGRIEIQGSQQIMLDGETFQLVSSISPQGAIPYFLTPEGEIVWLARFFDQSTTFDDMALVRGNQILLREGLTTFDNVTFPDVTLTNGGVPVVEIPGGTFDGVKLVEIGAGLAGSPLGFVLPNDGLDANSFSMSPNGRFIISEVGIEHPVNGERLAALVLIDFGEAGRLCADQNADGEVNDSDFFAWVTNFFDQDPVGDVNQDGAVTDSDFFAWVTFFLQGSDGPTCLG